MINVYFCCVVVTLLIIKNLDIVVPSPGVWTILRKMLINMDLSATGKMGCADKGLPQADHFPARKRL